MAVRNETKIGTLYLNFSTDYITEQNTKLNKSYQTTYREACQIRNIHKIREMKNISQT